MFPKALFNPINGTFENAYYEHVSSANWVSIFHQNKNEPLQKIEMFLWSLVMMCIMFIAHFVANFNPNVWKPCPIKI